MRRIVAMFLVYAMTAVPQGAALVRLTNLQSAPSAAGTLSPRLDISTQSIRQAIGALSAWDTAEKEFLKNNTIVLLGGTGFVGGHVI